MSNSSLAFSSGEILPDFPSPPASGLQAQNSVQFLERIHDRMRDRISNALALQHNAHIKYRMCMHDGRLAAIDYHLFGADVESRSEVDEIVSAAVIEGSGANADNALGSVVQWVRVAVVHQASVGDINVK